MESGSRVPVAVFDFDGTITRRDSTIAFCLAVVPPWRLWPSVARLSPQLAGYGLGLVRNHVVKEALLGAFFTGVHEVALAQQAATWALRSLPGLVRPAALTRLRWHQSRGHRVVIASAALGIFLEPWARAVGIRDVLATALAAEDGRLTGRIQGANCYGREKVNRLQALLGNLEAIELYAYGDSRGDRELLAVAHHSFYRPFRRWSRSAGSMPA